MLANKSKIRSASKVKVCMVPRCLFPQMGQRKALTQTHEEVGAFKVKFPILPTLWSCQLSVISGQLHPRVLAGARTGTRRAANIRPMVSGLLKSGSFNRPGFVNQRQCSMLVRKKDVDPGKEYAWSASSLKEKCSRDAHAQASLLKGSLFASWVQHRVLAIPAA